MSNSVQPHRRQPTRLPHPWSSPGKNTGVSCHFLLQCMKVKSQSEVAQSCLTLSDLMDCSQPASSVHGVFQARVLEWGAIAFPIWATVNMLPPGRTAVAGMSMNWGGACGMLCWRLQGRTAGVQVDVGHGVSGHPVLGPPWWNGWS